MAATAAITPKERSTLHALPQLSLGSYRPETFTYTADATRYSLQCFEDTPVLFKNLFVRYKRQHLYNEGGGREGPA